jgi:eukaryotic-like serine/threonine-protein kinase
VTRDPITLSERYVLEASIASGGMATVWRARDDVLARPVAVKVLHPHFAEDDSFIERFRREALAAAGLAHPHIVSIYDTGSERNSVDGIERHYIVMEFCGGGTLAELLKENGHLESESACSIGASICEALEYAHRNDIIHRDIKPQNVLMTEDRSLKVADFGIAKAAITKTDITATGAILGTVTYLSPEQVMGREPGPQSDIYSAGVLLYELLTGRPPFDAETPIATAMAHARTPPPAPRSIRANVPRPVEQVILKAMAKDPGDRYATAAEMANALRSVATESATGVLQTPRVARRDKERSPNKPRRARELRWLVPVVLLIFLGAVAAFIVPGLLDDDTNGGSDPGPPTGAQSIEIRSVKDFDPLGDNSEHHDETGNAADGDAATTWSTENYSTPMHELKDGVGLVLDLGDPSDVTQIDVASPTPGYTMEVRVSNEDATDVESFELASELSKAPAKASVQLDEPTQGRYWLLLLTRLPGDGSGTAEVAEVKFFGS